MVLIVAQSFNKKNCGNTTEYKSQYAAYFSHKTPPDYRAGGSTQDQ
jgi:hypothetical protein